MKIIIETPTKAYLSEYQESDLKNIKDQLTYVDKSVEVLIKKHKEKDWLKRRDPDMFYEQLKDLEDQKHCSALFKDEKGYWIRAGSIPYLLGKYEVLNNITYPALKPLKWHKELDLTPHNYQANSVSNLLAEKHGCVSLATGLGKSLILLLLAREIGDCVVVTPSASIFSELYASFQEFLGADRVGGYGDGKKDIKKPITIAICRSLTMLKEGTKEYEFFKNKKGLVVDEAHTFSADTLDATCHGALKDIPYRFFASGTLVNNSGKTRLLNSIIGKCVYSKTIKEGIDEGFLCPLKFNIKRTFSPSTKFKKDPIECKRIHLLYNKEVAKFYGKLASAMWKAKQESTLILVEELVQIQMLKEFIDVPFTYIHSASKKEAAEWGLEKVDLTKELERFNTGEVKVLIGTKSIAIGTNIYPTHNAANWVGGSSEIPVKQGIMGRCTRWMKDRYAKFHKPKKFTRIWDVDISGQMILQNQLKTRIKFYKETGEDINYID